MWKEVTHVESDGLMKVLFLPEYEPIAGQHPGDLHQKERKQESGDQDVSVSSRKVRPVDLPGDSTIAPFLLLHDRLAFLELLPRGGNRLRAIFTVPFLPFPDFVDIPPFLLLL